MNNEQLEELAGIFDTIISSKNPGVQQAFNHLMVLATLSKEDNVNDMFRSLFNRITWLESEVKELRKELQISANRDFINGVTVTEDPYLPFFDVNMNSTPVTLTTAPITALTVDMIQIDLSLTPDKIKF